MDDLQSLLAVTVDYLNERIAGLQPGALNLYPVTQLHEQEFSKDLGDGISLHIQNHYEVDRFFTWEELRDVVVGLKLYMVTGGRNWQTQFRFYNGDYPASFTQRFLGCGELIIDESDRNEEVDTELTAA